MKILLGNSNDQIFCIEFMKKVADKEIVEMNAQQHLDNEALSRLIAEGERKVVTGTLRDEKMGRFTVEDIYTVQGQNLIYHVEFNKIISLILDNCKYIVKSGDWQEDSDS